MPGTAGHRVRVGAFAELVRCDNPGPMELDGTNTWVLGAPGADRCVVFDPGPDGHRAHLAAVAAGRRVELVLVSHGHLDHTGAVPEFFAMTGAATRAFSPEHCRAAPPLADRERFTAAGLDFEVVHTPGHTSDSVCVLVAGLGERAILTGDTVLGQGTTLVGDEPGAVRSYLGSLARLAALGPVRLLPGHGPDHEDLQPVVAFYSAHRRQRLDSIREYLLRRGLRAGDADPQEVVDELYTDTPAGARFAAVITVRGQLDYLAEEETPKGRPTSATGGGRAAILPQPKHL